MEPQKQEMQIKVRDEELKGAYSNLMQIVHMKEEFVLDFFLSAPPQGMLASRVIVSPSHAKRIAAAMADAVKKYEEKFGPIQAGSAPEAISVSLNSLLIRVVVNTLTGNREKFRISQNRLNKIRFKVRLQNNMALIPYRGGWDIDRWLEDEDWPSFKLMKMPAAPKVDVYERTENGRRSRASGFKPGQISAQIKDNALVIEARSEKKKKKKIR